MYVKIGYVEKYSNPCLRGLIVFLASGIWLAAVFPVMQILLPLGDKVFESPIPDPLKSPMAWLLGPVPIVLWIYFYPSIVSLIIIAGEWLWKRRGPVAKPFEKYLRRLYKAIVRFDKSLSKLNSELIDEDLRKRRQR